MDKIQKNRPHICHVEKCQIYVKNLNNLWSFIEIFAVFVLNLCGEKSAWKKYVWRKNDKNEVSLKVDPNLSEEDLDGIIAEIDEDGSGTMDFDEFCEMMMTSPEDSGE